MGFELTTLGHYVKIQGGYAYKSHDFLEESNNKVLKIKNIRAGYVNYDDCAYISDELASKTKAWLVSEGDVLISMTGSGPNAPQSLVGRVGRVWNGVAYLNQRVGRVILKSNCSIHLGFIYYYLSQNSTQEYFVANSTGSANQANISGKTIEDLPFPIVEFEDSYRISKVLLDLDKKIQVNFNINQTIEQMAQALFKSWFVDFEPVKAKIAVLEAGGSQEDATLAAMTAISGKDADTLAVFEREHPEHYAELKATAELFPSAMQECEGGAIPKGWRSGSVTNVTDKVFSGGTPTTTKSEYWNGEFHWFSSGETRNSVITNTEKTITTLGVEQSSTKKSVLGDVLIASAGQGHTRGQTSLNMINTYINQSVVAVRPKNKILTCWLYMNLRSRYEEMRGISDSHSSRGSLTTKLVSGMPVVIPSENILQKFEKSIFPLFDSVKHSQREIDSLTQLRDTLLPKLLSGEITLPEAEQAVSEAENV